MKTAVDKVLSGKARDVNARCAAMVSHYLFEVEFCNPASGWEKGQIEKNVRDARHRLWQPVPAFPSLDALNAWLEERRVALWKEIPHYKQPGSVYDVWQLEKPTLMRLPCRSPSCRHDTAVGNAAATARQQFGGGGVCVAVISFLESSRSRSV